MSFYPKASVKNGGPYRNGKVHKHPLYGEHHSAGRSQHDQAEVDDLEQDDAEDGFKPSRADDVRLGQADLFGPCADVEGVRKADEDIDDRQINRSARREMPREQGQGKDGHAIRRKCDGVVSKPSATIGDVAVDIVDIESIYLPEEEEGE